MVRRRRAGVDTTVLLNYLVDTGSAADAQRVEHSTWVVEEARAGEHQLIVPALVLAEIAGDGFTRGSHIVPRERQQRIARVMEWIHSEEFMVVDIDALVGRAAAQLAINNQMKGADASIVAACQQARCDVLYTWDNGMLKLDGRLPGMRVMQPKTGDQQTVMSFSA